MRSAIILLLTSIAVAAAEISAFDDPPFVDPTFECPAKTTCPVVCVAEGSTCPASLQCPAGKVLCDDGSCDSDCTAANDAFDKEESPCPECTPVICPRIVNFYDQCKNDYQVYYDQTAECEENMYYKKYNLLEGAFVVVYVFVTVITSAMFLWCAINQRFFRVTGSTQSLSPVVGVESYWTQTGYKGGYSLRGHLANPIGMILYYSLLIMLFCLHGILAMTTIWYYVVIGSITRLKNNPFEDEVNILQAFILTWIVTFPISFLIKWPPSIISLYLRRSVLKHATHVAVFTPLEAAITVDDGKSTQRLANFLSKLYFCFNAGMRFIFSDVNNSIHGEVTYCPVVVKNGSRYFMFRLRRYIYDDETAKFEPSSFNVGATIGDFSSAKNGLSTSQVMNVRRHVGPNTIDIKKPFILRSILNEFSKPFYTYQMFMVWAWFPFNYYFMAIVLAIIIISGGLSVSFFSYRNERNLYRLSRVSGSVPVLRDGAMVICSQDELVPGDVVEIKPGIIFADMIILSTDVVIVDESALTGESTPMAKSAIDLSESQEVFKHSSHKKHFLSAGTTCTEVSVQSFALVLRTGSYTAKGELLRDVISFRRHKFKFDTQVNLVVLILACYAIFGFVLSTFYYKDDFAYEFFYGM